MDQKVSDGFGGSFKFCGFIFEITRVLLKISTEYINEIFRIDPTLEISPMFHVQIFTKARDTTINSKTQKKSCLSGELERIRTNGGSILRFDMSNDFATTVSTTPRTRC